MSDIILSALVLATFLPVAWTMVKRFGNRLEELEQIKLEKAELEEVYRAGLKFLEDHKRGDIKPQDASDLEWQTRKNDPAHATRVD